jgi:hypothetical protein
MPIRDPSPRFMNEYRSLALDLAARMPSILDAMKKNGALFNRAKVTAVRDFAREGMLQRGGSVSSLSTNATPEQIADDLTATIARIDNLTNRLRRSRFGRDPLLEAGLSIRAACIE